MLHFKGNMLQLWSYVEAPLIVHVGSDLISMTTLNWADPDQNSIGTNLAIAPST